MLNSFEEGIVPHHKHKFEEHLTNLPGGNFSFLSSTKKHGDVKVDFCLSDCQIYGLPRDYLKDKSDEACDLFTLKYQRFVIDNTDNIELLQEIKNSIQVKFDLYFAFFI